MSKLEITEKVIIQYDIILEIPTKYGLISERYKDVDSCRKPLADNPVDFLIEVTDYIDFKTYDENRFYVTFVTSFNSKYGSESHMLDLTVETEESNKFEAIKEFLGSKLAEKYNLRFVKTTNPNYNPVSVDYIHDKDDIKAIVKSIL